MYVDAGPEITGYEEHYAAMLFFPIPYSLFPMVLGEARNNSSKLTERFGNVYENKGSLWITRR
jgi:hypothetical protein